LCVTLAACGGESQSAGAPAIEQAKAHVDAPTPHEPGDELPHKGEHPHGGHHGADHPTPHAKPDGASHKHEGGHHRFEDAEKWAKVFDSPDRDEWQKPDALTDWLGLRAEDVVADIGAGTGYFAMRFARKVPDGKVIANDIEASMVTYLEERARKEGLANLVAAKGSATGVGFEEKVDLAFVCDVYHHIADRTAYFTALGGQLEKDGRVVIVDFSPEAPEDAPGPPRAMRLAPDQVIAELEKAKLTLSRRNDELLPYQYILEFKRK
jgi:ubiquinone/menaquinone biosynthesis C-methylase UbiE